MKEKQKDVGLNYDKVVSMPTGKIINEIYKEHTKTLVNALIRHFPYKKEIKCLELGGGNGALIKDIVNSAKDKKLHFTNIDKDGELLKQDTISEIKIKSKVENLDLSKFSEKYDVIIIRYVLNYNPLSIQDKIIGVAKTLLDDKGIFLIHHCGSKNINHRNKLNEVFSTKIVSGKLVRNNPYWSTWEELYRIIKNHGFKNNVLEHYKIPIGNLYKERNKLTNEEEIKLHEYLGNYDFIDYVISENLILKKV